MAKGLRSKSKRKHKAVKRNVVFAQTEDERVVRLAESLKKNIENIEEAQMKIDEQEAKIDQDGKTN